MKYQPVTVKKDSFYLLPFGDIHFGHKNVDTRILDNVVDYITKNKDVYWVGLGDYGDAIIPNDYRFDYRSIDERFKTPQEQYGALEEMFAPISNKCVGLLDGNHDIVHWKKHAHNYVKELAEDLGVPYLTVDAYLRFHFTKFNADYNCYFHHGWTGARTAGGRIARIYDLYNIFPMLDLYAMGHIHSLGMPEPRTALYIDKDEIHEKISRFLYTGSFLRAYVKDSVSYVEEKTYPPATLGSPLLKISPYKGKYGVNFAIEFKEIR